MFKMVGALCGLAIYNSIIVDLSFPQVLFKKLLNEKPSFDDLKELDPVMANSLQMLLDYDKSDIDDVFALNFEVILCQHLCSKWCVRTQLEMFESIYSPLV